MGITCIVFFFRGKTLVGCPAGQLRKHSKEICSLPETKQQKPLEIGQNPKGKNRLPTIHFQGRNVSFREAFPICLLGRAVCFSEATSWKMVHFSIATLDFWRALLIKCLKGRQSPLCWLLVFSATFLQGCLFYKKPQNANPWTTIFQETLQRTQP